MEIIVMGDLNIDRLHGSSKADRLLANMEAYQFFQLIDTATRVTSDSSTLIDHVYVTCPERITKVSVLPVGISDHFAILTVYANKSNLRDDRQKVLRYRDHKSFNPDNFLADMAGAPWYMVEQSVNPNEALASSYDIFEEVLNAHAPIKKKRVKRWVQPEWITDKPKYLQCY